MVITGTCAWNSLTTAFTLRQETVLFTQESKSCQGWCKLLGYNYASSSKQQHRGTCGHALIIEVLRMLNVQCIEPCSSASGTAASLLFTASARAFAVTELKSIQVMDASMNCRSMLDPYLRNEEEALPEAHLKHQTE